MRIVNGSLPVATPGRTPISKNLALGLLVKAEKKFKLTVKTPW